jgi:prefoldin subunit 5
MKAMSLKAKTSSDRHRSHTVDEAIKKATSKDTVKLTFLVPKDAKVQLKAKAAANDETVTEVLLRAIQEYINK